MNLSVDIAGVTMKNPVTTGSGTFGSGEEFSEFVDLSKLGAVTTKGVANVPWPGNSVPRVAEVYGGGGHIKAAGVMLKDTNIIEAKEKLLNVLKEELNI